MFINRNIAVFQTSTGIGEPRDSPSKGSYDSMAQPKQAKLYQMTMYISDELTKENINYQSENELSPDEGFDEPPKVLQWAVIFEIDNTSSYVNVYF